MKLATERSLVLFVMAVAGAGALLMGAFIAVIAIQLVSKL